MSWDEDRDACSCGHARDEHDGDAEPCDVGGCRCVRFERDEDATARKRAEDDDE